MISAYLEPLSPFCLVPMEILYATDIALYSLSEKFNTETLFPIDHMSIVYFYFLNRKGYITKVTGLLC